MVSEHCGGDPSHELLLALLLSLRGTSALQEKLALALCRLEVLSYLPELVNISMLTNKVRITFVVQIFGVRVVLRSLACTAVRRQLDQTL